ncbi:MAG: hypothetical protein ED559_00625 [Phycisphaera sp.]|nr:MAG: hypothetical protein ED559_00625 [Phycisphaera sp.]
MATQEEGEVLKPEIMGWVTEPCSVVTLHRCAMPIKHEPTSIALRISGRVTGGVNLTHAGFGGAGDEDVSPGVELPVDFEGELTIDEASGVASFSVIAQPEGEKDEPPFGIVLEDVIMGVTVTAEEIVIADVFDEVSFSLVINRRTGTGRFSYQETVDVGLRTVTRIAEGLIVSSAEEFGEVSGRTLLAAGLFASRRRHATTSCGKRESE